MKKLKIEYYRIDCSKFCGSVSVKDGIIISAMPIVKKFVGQSFDNLISWTKYKFGNVKIERLNIDR